MSVLRWPEALHTQELKKRVCISLYVLSFNVVLCVYMENMHGNGGRKGREKSLV